MGDFFFGMMLGVIGVYLYENKLKPWIDKNEKQDKKTDE
jgi:hypothetical protein